MLTPDATTRQCGDAPVTRITPPESVATATVEA